MNPKKAERHLARSLLGQPRSRFLDLRGHVSPTYPTAPVIVPSPAPRTAGQWPHYSVCLAETDRERRAAFRLRFQVFNLEMREGLESSYETGEDTDPFDGICDHLIVRHAPTGEVVGTYR